MYGHYSPRNPGVSILKELLKRIKLDEDLVRENNAILHRFLHCLVQRMREVDDTFDLLFVELYFTGSYYSDLRVSKPDEFDINLILKKPFPHSEYSLERDHQDISYVKITLPNHSEVACAEDRYSNREIFMPSKVREWFQSVVDRALQNLTLPTSCSHVISRTAGPARMLEIIKQNGDRIHVDLVPVFECTLDLQGSIDSRVASKTGRVLKAFLVPKPHILNKETRRTHLHAAALDADFLWRTHFPDTENELIHDLGCVKPVIRLLKFLRDKEGWSCLASYYLKTVVMWMVIENKNNPNYWREENMFMRFLQVLQKLEVFALRKNIPYLFNKNYNLIERIDYREAEKIRNRLHHFIARLSLDCNQLWDIFQEDR